MRQKVSEGLEEVGAGGRVWSLMVDRRGERPLGLRGLSRRDGMLSLWGPWDQMGTFSSIIFQCAGAGERKPGESS